MKLVILILAFAVLMVNADVENLKRSIKKLTDCKGEFDDGTIFDLKPLDDVKSPL